jgi:hypothetical protein
VQRPLRHHRLAVVAHHSVGAPGPVLHRDRGVAHRKAGEFGDQLRFVLGEQADSAVLEVGHDRLDLPTGQDTVPVGGGRDRELP